eukprot:TRINITY_DN5552_c0_g1_i1.p1 TRINITY_DN5552_c0_g1~~TRINITY_DN5552_c0_g1_i1.p1  ORF type:complete len:371 (+),score=107.86 TRINITY_DN5552_c0_g1_i1:72-1184(+)
MAAAAAPAASRWLRGHKDVINAVTAVGAAPAEARAASASADGTVRVWDVERGRAAQCVTCFGGEPVLDLCFGSAPGSPLLYCAAGPSVYASDLRCGVLVRQALWAAAAAAGDDIQHIAPWTGGVAAGSDGGQVVFIAGTDEPPPAELPRATPHSNIVTGLAPLRGGRVASAGGDFAAAVSCCGGQGSAAEVLCTAPLPRPDFGGGGQLLNPPVPTACAAAPDGSAFAVGTLDGTCWLLDEKLTPRALWVTEHGSAAEGVACCSAGLVWSVAKSGVVQQWDTAPSAESDTASGGAAEGPGAGGGRVDSDAESDSPAEAACCVRGLRVPDAPTCCAWAPYLGEGAVLVGDVQGDVAVHYPALLPEAAHSGDG